MICRGNPETDDLMKEDCDSISPTLDPMPTKSTGRITFCWSELVLMVLSVPQD